MPLLATVVNPIPRFLPDHGGALHPKLRLQDRHDGHQGGYLDRTAYDPRTSR